MGDRGGAVELYRKVAEAQPGSAQALNNLAYLLSEVANKPDEALKYAQQAAVELVPKRPVYIAVAHWDGFSTEKGSTTRPFPIWSGRGPIIPSQTM